MFFFYHCYYHDLFNSSTMIILSTVCTKAAMQKALVLVLTQDTKKGMVDNPGAGQVQCIRYIFNILNPFPTLPPPQTLLGEVEQGACGNATIKIARWLPAST